MLAQEPAHLGVLRDQLHDLRTAELNLGFSHDETVLLQYSNRDIWFGGKPGTESINAEHTLSGNLAPKGRRIGFLSPRRRREPRRGRSAEADRERRDPARRRAAVARAGR